MSEGIFLLHLTVSQKMALIDILIEHQMEPNCSREFVDIARNKTTRHGELLVLLDRAVWFSREALGQILSDAIRDGAPNPDYCDAREIDRLVDALFGHFARKLNNSPADPLADVKT
jgi:hypothetical protein